MASDPENSNSAPVTIESDDDDHRTPAVHELARMSLQNAIKSAFQSVLAKTLLEICEQKEASKELAKALLLPPLTPPAPQGTKRSASPTEVLDRTCERCGRRFSDTVQIMKDCKYHPATFPKRVASSD
jgi:hypothetical protein